METVNQNVDKLQIVEIILGDSIYGVNILKVKEILEPRTCIKLPNNTGITKGLFDYRGDIVPIIDLHKALNIEVVGDVKNLLVLNFNDKLFAFEVAAVVGTSTYGWDLVTDVDGGLKNESNNSYTGIINTGSKLIILIDFETIIMGLSGVTGVTLAQSEIVIENTVNKKSRIIFAEDSGMMSKLIYSELSKAGFDNIKLFPDGKEALLYIENTEDVIDLFILDIEMPYVNGFTLTKEIKSVIKFKHVPVILFSSLINDETRSRGKEVGADYQISKPNINELITIVGEALRVK